jgi:hypothetical protein
VTFEVSRMSDFSCEECGCPAFTLPGSFSDESPVECAECGAIQCTWAERNAQAERLTPASMRTPSAYGEAKRLH